MRKTIIILSCCTVALLLGYSGYRGYEVWKQSHWLSMAKKFAAKSDGRNELLSLVQVLRSNPNNLEATRMMADLDEAIGSRNALALRRRVLELNPKSLDDRLALVQTAMVFKDYAVATNALAGVSEADRKTFAYNNLAGVLAMTMGQADAAGAYLNEAARIEPGNPVPIINLAVLRLHGTNTLDMAEARIDLKRIVMNSTNMVMRSQAERELVIDALRFKNSDAALSLSKELVQQTNSTYSDRLLRLDVLRVTKSSEFKPTLALYQQEAATNSANLLELANWQMTRISPAATLSWLQSLPVNVQTNQPAASLAAQCQMLTHDWNGLNKSLQKQSWGELDYTRHAFMARALRGLDLDEASKAEWETALNEAGGQKPTRLIALFRLAAQWNWESECEDILWTIVNQFPDEKWATQILGQVLYETGQTKSLMQLYKQESQTSPSDLSLKNNLAMTALLLNAQDLKPYELAREVYQKSPTNASFVSTYAFSLYLQGKNAEALKLMKTLKPQELQNQSIAGYYGLILKATGDRARARSYLDWTAKARLLPEERKLFDNARAGL
jgi:predicted Zn-dependent protease